MQMASLPKTLVARPTASLRAVLQFRRAHAFWHFRAFDRSIPLLEDLVQEHPHHPLTELGGALLLDALAGSGRRDQLTMWLDLFIHMDGFLDDKPSLRNTVRDFRRRFPARDHGRVGNQNR
jgi:hypothetical protein